MRGWSAGTLLAQRASALRAKKAAAHQIMSSGWVSGKAAATEEGCVSVQVWGNALCPLQQHWAFGHQQHSDKHKVILSVIA